MAQGMLGERYMRRILLLAVVSAALGCTSGVEPEGSDATGESETTGQAASALVNANFTVTGLAQKCVDVGGDAYQAVGAPVFMYGCNGTTAQKLRVVEADDGSHDVSLRSSMGFCIGVRGGSVVTGATLELQTCVAESPAQRFALDGDTIFVGTQARGRVTRDLVVEVDRGRGANRTPLVVGTRELDPAEDFRFGATSFAALLPTSGFKMVMSVGDLDRALGASHWGSVIEVAPNTSIRIDDDTQRRLKEGVTLRSNRRGMTPGSEIYRANGAPGSAFVVDADNVRVTGLRLRGPSTSKDGDLPKVVGITSNGPAHRVLIDHNEMSGWTDSAVMANGTFEDKENCFVGEPPPQDTRVIANYFHHNSRRNAGYGVVSMRGGNPYIDGNTFTANRHAIAADPRGHTSYTAVFNLVTAGNSYCDYWGIVCWKEHDFDVHGNDEDYQGGDAGHSFEMRANTFLSGWRFINIRGTPCNFAHIRENVMLWIRAWGEWAIRNPSDKGGEEGADTSFLSDVPPSTVGDFDGDGAQDDFMGTGAAWYYRPGRTTEWRLLNRFKERTEQLTFGDFDGDGRTDVRIVDAQGVTQTSWGGSSPWDSGSRPIPRIPGGPLVPVTSGLGALSGQVQAEGM